MKSITIFNFKGGQGKTSIALNLALSLDINIITNDKYTWLDLVLPKNLFMVVEPYQCFPKIPSDLDIIYDLGGWLDTRTTEIIYKSDLVIIPMINNVINNVASLNSIDAVKKINKKILVIANSTNEESYKELKKIIKNAFSNDEIDILPLKKSTAFDKTIFYQKSIKEIVEENKVLSYHYKGVLNQFDNITNYVKEKVNL